ncbi:hypothetical protein SLINC_4851 [Streptomyces lincolnensis]|uniref:Uncharacterized protein n=1 Tax=Streptomyces lincolnensis TaxID=1915 RepID=A0A1B1MEM4_STRLN|nr:hypothetical protein [Streptomyces lincolnensis]ANS67075.1 hypothetical protein SLINC_4851 [Streptomyces lincolnensis]AXG55947.1 hypothetical protein SLCG_4792 [Streptomyces lincolnensis]QMV07576.1 hypothetical protein GJU35_19105 [Streptomyces lincolnensis]
MRAGLRLRGLVVWGVALAVVGGAVPVAGAVGDGPAEGWADGGPEADLAYHGLARMASGRVDVRFTPRNHGPSAVPDATVRLRWSEPLVDRQAMPEGCARSGRQVVLCRIGALAADGLGERVELRVRLLGMPSEVLLEIDTVWSGGAVDRNRLNDRQRVLVLDTGDEYYF